MSIGVYEGDHRRQMKVRRRDRRLRQERQSCDSLRFDRDVLPANVPRGIGEAEHWLVQLDHAIGLRPCRFTYSPPQTAILAFKHCASNLGLHSLGYERAPLSSRAQRVRCLRCGRAILLKAFWRKEFAEDSRIPCLVNVDRRSKDWTI